MPGRAHAGAGTRGRASARSGTGAQYTVFIQNEIRTWGPVIRAAGVKGN